MQRSDFLHQNDVSPVTFSDVSKAMAIFLNSIDKRRSLLGGWVA